MTITVGVLALQGAFLEHLVLLKRAADYLRKQGHAVAFKFTEVRNVKNLSSGKILFPNGNVESKDWSCLSILGCTAQGIRPHTLASKSKNKEPGQDVEHD